MPKIYIYNLPFEVNRDLCRLLDIDDIWKELAGVHMKFKAFDIEEIEQTSRRQQTSPTEILLTRWGQLNHTVSELFICLYKMKHIPAMRCLTTLVDEKFLRLLNKNGVKNGAIDRNSDAVDVNGNRCESQSGSQAFIPRPVVELEQDVPQTSSGIVNGNSPCESSRASSSVTSSSQDSRSTSKSHSKGDMNDEMIRHILSIPGIKYEELREATNNWHDSNLLGRGGFGQVYKGEWKLTTVAVKRLKNGVGDHELIREMCLNQYRHDNILPLYGYSLGGSESCLVYQLMPGGSLEQRLRCRPPFAHPLSWPQRHTIAHGVARGLQFLHTMTSTPLIHGDIKPANILLDQCGIPRIGDFGLARQGPYGEEKTHLKVSRVNGTRPYLPEEYLRSHYLSPAVDVFSFGVVLMEMATCLPCWDKERAHPLLSDHIHHLAQNWTADQLAYLEDRMIFNTPMSNSQLCRDFISLGILCTAPHRRSRPNMLQVFRQLDALTFIGKGTN